jgi:hypothetical protein
MARLFVRGAALAVLLAVLAAGAGSSHHARANGVPQLVKLTYLEGVSNFGPTDAEGVLEFSFAEAYARVDVKHLKPATGYTYEGWLTGGAEAPFRVGEIKVDAAGLGVLDAKLTGLNSYGYDLFVIAARPSSDHGAAMPTELSIAGRFTVIGDEHGTAAGGDARPGTLPSTGEKPANDLAGRFGRALTAAGVAGAVAFVVLSFKRRRSAA